MGCNSCAAKRNRAAARLKAGRGGRQQMNALTVSNTQVAPGGQIPILNVNVSQVAPGGKGMIVSSNNKKGIVQ